MISIQDRLFLTDKSKQEGKEFEPLFPVNEEEFIALSKSVEFQNRAKKVIPTSGGQSQIRRQRNSCTTNYNS